jgi:integrase
LLSVAEKRVSEVKHAVHKQERQLLYDWIVVMVHSGLRPEESRNLTWGEVSLDGDTPKLHIAASKSKRRKQRDTFTMPAAIERLKEMKERQENHLEAIGKKLKPSDYIFSAMKKDGLAQVKSFKGGFRRLVDACSFSRSKADGELSGESLRHTYATMRLEEGTDQHRLADNMGTSSLMIHRHYGHIQLGHFYQELTKTRSDPQTSSPDVAALSEKFDEVLANSKKDKSESITEIYRKQVKKEWLEQNYGKEPSEEPGGEEIFEGWVFIRMKEEGHGDLYEMPDDLPDSLPD